jgi:SAM-dependent methyltransferase
MSIDPKMKNVKEYFDNTLKAHGATPRGVDWNSEGAREVRFEQLSKVITRGQPFTMLDYGCGYAAYADYLESQHLIFSRYTGFDILESMVEKAREIHSDTKRFYFTSDLAKLEPVDYATACGVFNMKLDATFEEWTDYVLKCLKEMDSLSVKGFSVNFLTKYSDADKMRPDLYYADPCFLFDYCKTNFSKNVALLHDYHVYDFTLIIRKD